MGASRITKKGTASAEVVPVRAGPVSRVLYPGDARASVIYLGRQSPAASSNLPPGIGRATLNCRCTWSCNPRDVLPGDIAAPAVGSYPAFSPLPAGIPKIPDGRFFSVTLLYPYGYQVVSLRGALRCPDFPLPDEPAATERACGTKVAIPKRKRKGASGIRTVTAVF